MSCISLSSKSLASSISTLSVSLFGDLLVVVLGDVDLENLFMTLFALPILTSDPADVVSGGATLPSPATCDPVGMVIIASAELAPVSEPGNDCDAAPPGAAKENYPLLFPPELDIAGSVLTFVVVVSHKLVTSERLRLITCVWILITSSGSMQ